MLRFVVKKEILTLIIGLDGYPLNLKVMEAMNQFPLFSILLFLYILILFASMLPSNP
jgi:hypothetical protein